MKTGRKTSLLTEQDVEDLSKIGERLKELRKKKYSSYEAFGNTHGFSRVQMGLYEQGKNLEMLTFLRLLRALGKTPEEFFKDWNENDSPQ